MRIVFKAQHPLFGRANSRLPLKKQQASPYYWWWAFLKRNQRYLECCDNGGEGDLAALYRDFGDVRGDDFRLWWNAHGTSLFREQPPEHLLKELASKDDWLDHWQSNEVMVVAVPLTLPKNQINKFFSRLLKNRHSGKRGKRALSDEGASRALYPLHRNVSVKALETQLAVYDAIKANEHAEHKMTLAQIGAALRIQPSNIPMSSDTPAIAADKRNQLAATVSRYYRQATRIVEATAEGVFPANY